jgi:hypothetical protein
VRSLFWIFAALLAWAQIGYGTEVGWEAPEGTR